MAKPNREDVDDLFERRPDTRPVALALGRAVFVWLVGTVVVTVGDLAVGVESTAYLLPVFIAVVYGYLGYRKGRRLEAD